MTSPIWSLSRLEALLKHGEPSVRKWAASKLCSLYAKEISHLLPRLLDDEQPEVVLEALSHLRRNPVEDLIPALGKLYVIGVETVSSRAMQMLGDLRYHGAVEWMKERILDPKPLGPEQISAMIYALGRIESDDAYMLLKRTESAIREKDSSHWEMYYSALLQHRGSEDIGTLLRVVEEEEEGKDRYRDALGLLLGEVDPGLNPSNVFFLNTSPVRRHWLRRLEELAKGGSAADSPEIIGTLRDLVLSISPEASGDSTAALKRMAMDIGGASPFEESVSRQGLDLLEKGLGTEGKRYAVMCLVISALLTVIEEKLSPPPRSAVHTDQEKLRYLLGNRPPKRVDEELMADVLRGDDREEILPILISVLRDDPRSWGALRAVDMLGKLHAEQAIEELIEAFRKDKDDLFVQSLRMALRDIGIVCVPHLIPLLDSTDMAESSLAMEVLGRLPTREGVAALLDRSISLYAVRSSSLLNAMYEAGAEDFLPFLGKEYRPGEWELGRVYAHICLLNDLEPEGLREIKRDAVHGEALFEEHRRIKVGDASQHLSSISLELACRECGKKYHYEVTEVHLHPREGELGDDSHQDNEGGPYKNGIVVCDDLRCKNCGTLNRMRLTPGALAELAGESVRLLGLQKAGIRVPESHPVKHVRLDEREGKPLTLSDAEKEHLGALGISPTRPETHLALGKFYEYVKEFREARSFYLQALDLDSKALEAMAGLARLAHAEGNLKEAAGWIEDCYSILDKGHLFLAEDTALFKKTVREKRREFARELGVKPKEKPVEIRFSMDASQYPKNRPCPCGSGKKYKLCCMKGP
jgi:HEAT repeat protein